MICTSGTSRCRRSTTSRSGSLVARFVPDCKFALRRSQCLLSVQLAGFSATRRQLPVLRARIRPLTNGRAYVLTPNDAQLPSNCFTSLLTKGGIGPNGWTHGLYGFHSILLGKPGWLSGGQRPALDKVTP